MDFTMKNEMCHGKMVIFHSYVTVYQRVGEGYLFADFFLIIGIITPEDIIMVSKIPIIPIIII
jgi:hypothetical protein